MPLESPAPDLRQRLPRSPEAAGQARRFMRDLLADMGAARESVENAELVVSELVTNAVRHGEGAIQLRVSLEAASARIEVVDEGQGNVSAVRPREPDESGGWGLHIVEQLAERWGVFSGTTHVWAELPLRRAA